MSRFGTEKGVRLGKGDLDAVRRELETVLNRTDSPYAYMYTWNGNQKVEIRAERDPKGEKKFKHSIMDVNDDGTPVEGTPRQARRWLKF